MRTIQVKRGPDSTWHAYVPDIGEWLPTPFFGPATFEDVKRVLDDRNPGYRIEEVGD